MVNIFIDLEDLDRANNILNNTFTTYQTNKLILQGDISAIEKNLMKLSRNILMPWNYPKMKLKKILLI